MGTEENGNGAGWGPCANLRGMRAPLLVLLAALSAPAPASAQDPAVRLTCDETAGRFVIDYLPDASEGPDTDGLLRFMLLLDFDEAGTTIVGSSTLLQECVLGTVRYEIELAPLVPNVNLLGRCGGALAGTIAVKRDEVVVLETLELEALNCHERERRVARVVLEPGKEPAIEYRAYDNP